MASFKEAKIQLDRALRDLLSRNYLTELGQAAAEMIKLRTRLGYGVPEPGATRERLKPLSPSYKLQRKRMKLNENTSPSKSNLTKTGQLLSSLGVKKVSNNVVTVAPLGRRDDGQTNEKIGGYVTEQGRPFNNLSDVEQKRLLEKMRKDLQTRLEKALVKLR